MLQCYVLYESQNGKIKQVGVIAARLILKCQYFDAKLPTFAVVNSFTEYLIYVLNGTHNGKIKQIEAKIQIDYIIIYHYKTCLFLLQVCN